MLKKLWLIVTLLSFVFGTWYVVSWLHKPNNFPIKKVELVNHLKNQESKELQKIAAAALTGGFFSLDVELFRREFLLKLPWVKSVAVRKIWPNKLLVSIEEHKPIVRWFSTQKKGGKDRKIKLLSDKGIVFQPKITLAQQKKFSSMDLLTGPEGSAKNVLVQCAKMSEKLKKLTTQLKQCGMNERRSWRLILSNGIDIKLGKKNVIQQLDRFISIFSDQLNQYFDSIDYVDLRYSNGFAIKWNRTKKDI